MEVTSFYEFSFYLSLRIFIVNIFIILRNYSLHFTHKKNDYFTHKKNDYFLSFFSI
jgi:ABC-type transport system involved in cytochrome bd biosynthesis fused ATPase/permease subunit